MRTVKEIEADIQKVMDTCATYKTCKDGSYGACIYDKGIGELRKELQQRERLNMEMDMADELEFLVWLDYNGELEAYVINRLNNKSLIDLPMMQRQEAAPIDEAFYWATSPEGIAHWSSLNNSWLNYVGQRGE